MSWPETASKILSSLNWQMLAVFNAFYIYAVGFFAFFLLAIALYPATGSLKLGKPDEKPEFSNFSWFSMMFGAGLGVGLMVYATGEPLLEWASNPETVLGNVEPLKEETLRSTYRYVFLHNGFHAWAIYVVTAISMAYFAYTRDMPLTLRAALTPIFGRHINGPIGHGVDILGVIATVLGIAVTIGYGISQLADGAYIIFRRGLDCHATGSGKNNTQAEYSGAAPWFGSGHGPVDNFSRIGCRQGCEIPLEPEYGLVHRPGRHFRPVRRTGVFPDDLWNCTD